MSAAPVPGSDRNFGFVFTAFFSIVGLYPLRYGLPIRPWALGLAALFLLAAGAAPRVLHVPNVIWFRFGLLLAKVVNPIVLSLLYLVAFVPTGLLLRAVGKDPMRVKRDPSASTYWLPRTPPGPEPESMKMQF
jgi:hypothetical protein